MSLADVDDAVWRCVDEGMVYGVPEIDGDSEPMTALRFMRDFVATNRPVVVRRDAAVRAWPAMAKWTSDAYLGEAFGDEAKVTVSWTPDGRADAVTDGRFAKPCDEPMAMRAFLEALAAAGTRATNDGGPVPYAQAQNGCLATEFARVADDVAGGIPWAREAFGVDADAANVWLGGDRSVTSLHKDPYENCHTVVTGAKYFLLYPPTDRPCFDIKEVPAATWTRSDGDGEPRFRLVDDDPAETVSWIATDPGAEDAIFENPNLARSHPLHVIVGPGDVLYIPFLWYHRVEQRPRTITVNYWFDATFTGPYLLHNALSDLCELGIVSNKQLGDEGDDAPPTEPTVASVDAEGNIDFGT